MSMNYHKLRSSSSSLPMSTLFLSYDATHAFYSLCFSLSHGRFRTFFDGECRVAVIPDRDMGSTHLRWYFVQLQLRGTISKNAHCKLHSAGYWGRLFNGGYSPPDSPLEPPSSYLQSSTASFGSVLLFLTAVSRVPLPSILGTSSLSPSWTAARSKIKLEVPLLFPSRMILPRERERAGRTRCGGGRAISGCTESTFWTRSWTWWRSTHGTWRRTSKSALSSCWRKNARPIDCCIDFYPREFDLRMCPAGVTVRP